MMSTQQQIKPLFIAYACEPEKGSEPGVGWNLVYSISRIRPVWVITHPQHQAKLDAWLAEHNETSRIHAHYYCKPRWMEWMINWPASLNVYYYLWHLGAARLARRLHEQEHFDVAHHATYVRYWMPSAASMVGIPFVWGPVGGGESAPRGFLRGIGLRGRLVEYARSMVRWIFEHDPIVRRTARRAQLGLAGSEESAQRMRRIGAPHVEVMSAVGLVEADAKDRDESVQSTDGVLRFISVGRILHWKGFHFGLQAFAKAKLPANSQYIIVGDGPDRSRLEQLARQLGIADRVRFTGALARRDGLVEMQRADVLVHPSLHDSGGFVILEAMDLRKPIICLDLGGPAVCVDQRNGFKISVKNVEQSIDEMVDAMERLADPQLRARLGENGRARAIDEFSWDRKARQIDDAYISIVQQSGRMPSAALNGTPRQNQQIFRQAI